jgi:endonuclease G, mitochondrial
MTFLGYLKPNQINTLVTKAIDSDLVTMSRTFYLQGILKQFALSLPKVRDGSDLDQFQHDLIKLNETERLADGEVPLVQFLGNAASSLRLRGRAEADDFEQLANEIGNAARGVPKLPDPSQLREIRQNEAIIGLDEMVDFSFLAEGALAGRSVARVIIPRFENGLAIKTARGAPWVMSGTAWMIAPNLMLTNWHVINCRMDDEPSREATTADFEMQAHNTVAEFDYDTAGSAVTSIAVDSVLACSRGLDYAVLRLKSDPGRAPLRVYSQKIIFTAASYLPVNILQHPRGHPKRIAFRNNLVTGTDNDCIRYFTDTDLGSSGSPVCDDNWRVVALHRGAEFVRGVKYQGKSTAYVNYGTQIQSLLEDLQTTAPTLRSEIG